MSEAASTSVIHAYRTQCTMTDYPGRMSALMFTAGCNFRCGFCHNPDLFRDARKYTWPELEDICRAFRQQWVAAVVISGGEPTIHPELPDTVKFFKNRGFAVKLDTNGSNPDMLRTLLPSLDYVAMDLKCAIDHYPELTGFKDTDAIRQSIKLIMDAAKDYEFRTTVIETWHNDEELSDCGKVIQGARKYILQPFLPHDNLPWPALRTQPRTRDSFLHHAAEIVRPFVNSVVVRGEK